MVTDSPQTLDFTGKIEFLLAFLASNRELINSLLEAKMYYDYTVKIPKSKAGISRKTIKGVTYIYYAYHREYDPVKKYTVPKNTTIGKAVSDNPELMHPNAKFFEYFDDVDIPEMPERDAERSSASGTELI